MMSLVSLATITPKSAPACVREWSRDLVTSPFRTDAAAAAWLISVRRVCTNKRVSKPASLPC